MLDDKILTDTLYLNRYDAHVRKQVLDLLRETEKELVAKLQNKNLTAYSKARIKALLDEASAIIKQNYSEMQRQMDAEKLANHVIETTTKAIQSTLPIHISIDIGIPTALHMASIASNALFDGSPIPDWWAKQASDVQFKFAGIIRMGIIQGKGWHEIIPDVAMLMETSKRNAFALSHTAIQTIANDSRMAAFEENNNVIKYLVWRSTLDSHTCKTCMAYSNKKWDMTTKQPVGHKLPFRLPPVHIRDRCVMSAQTIYEPENGYDSTRASSLGQISNKTTFDQYLQRVPEKQRIEMLGKGRYELWKDGKITTSDLLDQTGRELSLKELQKLFN